MGEATKVYIFSTLFELVMMIIAGGWKADMKHGRGKYTWSDGSYYDGEFEKDQVIASFDGSKKEKMVNIFL